MDHACMNRGASAFHPSTPAAMTLSSGGFLLSPRARGSRPTASALSLFVSTTVDLVDAQTRARRAHLAGLAGLFHVRSLLAGFCVTR